MTLAVRPEIAFQTQLQFTACFPEEGTKKEDGSYAKKGRSKMEFSNNGMIAFTFFHNDSANKSDGEAGTMTRLRMSFVNAISLFDRIEYCLKQPIHDDGNENIIEPIGFSEWSRFRKDGSSAPKPEAVATMMVGRDTAGMVYVSASNNGHRPIKYASTPAFGEFSVITSEDGEQYGEVDSSNMRMGAIVKSYRHFILSGVSRATYAEVGSGKAAFERDIKHRGQLNKFSNRQERNSGHGGGYGGRSNSKPADNGEFAHTGESEDIDDDIPF